MGGFGSVKGPANIKAFMEKNMGTGGNTTQQLPPALELRHQRHRRHGHGLVALGVRAAAAERGAVIAQAGRYDDTFVRENGVWKFKKRTASNDTGRPGGAQVRPAAAPAPTPSTGQ